MLGVFSTSLAVKDIQKSKDFYQKIGFEPIAGDESQNWLILRNGETTIGLFQGMFEKNMMTFNPGWDNQCQALSSFDDVRTLCNRFESKGIEIVQKSLSDESGPASFSIEDPDGNPILFDQHV